MYNDFLKVRLLTVFLMFFPYWLIITKDAAKFLQKGILLFFFIFSIGMVVVSIISPLPYKYYNLFAASLLPVFALILTRLLFHFAIIYNLFFIILCFVSWIMFLPYDITIIQSLFLLSVCIICLICTFLMERVIRKFYIESRAFSFQKQDLQETNIRLKYLIALDGLTGIANRRTLDETLNNEWQRGLRNGNPLSVLLMDIDHFKFYNDTYGHQRGDECLKQVAKTLKAFARRPGDLAARYGGEEFAVILSNTELIEASIVATRILQAVQGLKISHIKSSVDLKVVTLSIGIAVIVPHPSLSVSQLIENADRALYCAKSQGRNRVAILDHQ
ncbi:MAG: GGDEF domain-containing protein [Desulfobacterales bacterium]|nr:GGDEF domain-containing protein [Desulfobacterales bacterium]MBF0396329.1 GGDEF domain-containing protein [Desulfobacterales bacterium]